jgi:F0F1-type ATP synthase, subunit a
VSALLAAGGAGYEAPSTADFWQPVFGSGPFAVTRASIVILLSVGLLSWWLLASTRKMAIVPGKSQYFTEQVYGIVRNSVARWQFLNSQRPTDHPLLFSMFVLILINNLFGVIPPVQFPTMSRIGFPAGLSLIIFVLYHYLGIRKMGLGGYFKHMIPQGVPGWVLVLLVPLELITYFFTRPVTLALRLFGNMFAGHLLLVLFVTGGEYLVLHSGSVALAGAGIFSYLMAFVMTLFELLVEFLQAYIFVLLAALYIAGSLADEH